MLCSRLQNQWVCISFCAYLFCTLLFHAGSFISELLSLRTSASWFALRFFLRLGVCMLFWFLLLGSPVAFSNRNNDAIKQIIRTSFIVGSFLFCMYSLPLREKSQVRLYYLISRPYASISLIIFRFLFFVFFFFLKQQIISSFPFSSLDSFYFILGFRIYRLTNNVNCSTNHIFQYASNACQNDVMLNFVSEFHV